MELGIQVELGVSPAEEERAVSRQSHPPQVSYEVGRVLVVVVHPLSTKKIIDSVSNYTTCIL